MLFQNKRKQVYSLLESYFSPQFILCGVLEVFVIITSLKCVRQKMSWPIKHVFYDLTWRKHLETMLRCFRKSVSSPKINDFILAISFV